MSNTTTNVTHSLPDSMAPLMDETTNESQFHYFSSTILPEEMLTTKSSNNYFNLIGNSSSTPAAYFDPMVTIASSKGYEENSSEPFDMRKVIIETTSKSSHRPQEERSVVGTETATSTFKSSSPSPLMSPYGVTSTPPPFTSTSIESPQKAVASAPVLESRVIKSTESISHGKKKFKSKHQSDENWHEFTLKSWDSKRHKTSSSSLNLRLTKLKERNLPVLKPKLKEQITANSSESRRRQNRISYASNIKTRKSGPLFGNGSETISRPMENILIVSSYYYCLKNYFILFFSYTFHSNERRKKNYLFFFLQQFYFSSSSSSLHGPNRVEG